MQDGGRRVDENIATGKETTRWVEKVESLDEHPTTAERIAERTKQLVNDFIERAPLDRVMKAEAAYIALLAQAGETTPDDRNELYHAAIIATNNTTP